MTGLGLATRGMVAETPTVLVVEDLTATLEEIDELTATLADAPDE